MTAAIRQHFELLQKTNLNLEFLRFTPQEFATR